eukprot:gnl/TRDRNA2_/TRDRNA2_131178_c0_seq1.p1 gnl/TRDRNA2_/TRDRNA2_131178_c0~~gnl/TRDRNA2_/TRDRNA2_131178_c0_seq1.p1  ORF type:complete len:790 (-),score=229.33 gnl/TRDRNA2_/TRDRNA2_131178_c0_seq1:146-2314(-)
MEEQEAAEDVEVEDRKEGPGRGRGRRKNKKGRKGGRGRGEAEVKSVAKEVEEEEEEEDEDSAGKQFVWDAAKGELVEVQTKEQDTDASNREGSATTEEGTEGTPSQPQEEAAGDKDDEEEDDDSEEDDDDEPGDGGADQLESESRSAFIDGASTPELIKQAVSVGGELARGVSDRWVLDQATKLSFRYDTNKKVMHCWNPEQGCMYVWRNRGKLDFLWASPGGASAQPPADPFAGPPRPAAAAPATGDAAAASEAPRDEPQADPLALWVTVLPPKVLAAGSADDPDMQVEEEIELPAKAIGAIIGKGGAAIQELEKHSGAKASMQQPGEGENVGILRLEGTKAQVASAKSVLDQQIVMKLGASLAEKMQKHRDKELLERKRTESGADAAKVGVPGLSEFCQKWGLKAVLARRVGRLDAMLQRHLIRHFNPKKAKPVNALRPYLTALMMYPQRWRLEALYEDGELDGEICETVPLQADGALVGCQGEVDEVKEASEVQLIELECNIKALGEKEASRVYGDVQKEHCRLFRQGPDFYAWALDSKIGTMVDGQKYREHDGPVPLRDGSILAIGKYLLYCEMGTAATLQDRRARLLRGERIWKPPPKCGGGDADAVGSSEGPQGVADKEAEAAKSLGEGQSGDAGESGDAEASKKRKREGEDDEDEGDEEDEDDEEEDAQEQTSDEPAGTEDEEAQSSKGTDAAQQGGDVDMQAAASKEQKQCVTC